MVLQRYCALISIVRQSYYKLVKSFFEFVFYVYACPHFTNNL